MSFEKESQDTQDNDLIALRRTLISLEGQYNSARQELFNRMRSYYNQSIGSNVITEEKLRELLRKCEELKQSYASIQTKVMDNRPHNKWSFRDGFVFSKGE